MHHLQHSMADGRFDDLLLAMARKHKNVEELNYSVLSFFERRTDLFHIMETPTDRMGFKPGAAEDMIFKHFYFFQHKYLGRVQPKLLKEAYGVKGGNTPKIEEVTSATPSASSSSVAPAPAAAAAIVDAAADCSVPRAPSDQPAMPESTRKMMKHISTWNGAITDKYYWSQSLEEVTMEVEVEECRAKDMQVNITATRLSIKCKGKTVLEGKLHEKVNTEETVWHLDNSRQVVISMEKQRSTWWKCVLEGDQEIDTSKVESTRKVEEYDGETQGAIRKIMFDQNQKAQNKPTSDQIRTAEMMKEAWNAPGSPFRGSEFDPSMLNLSGPVGEEFFKEVQEKRIADAIARRENPDAP